MTTIEEAKKVLADAGFVVLREKSYRQAQERQRVAEALKRAAEERAEDARAWAVDCLNEERRLYHRCTYLYGLAARHGATDEELRGYAEETAVAALTRLVNLHEGPRNDDYEAAKGPAWKRATKIVNDLQALRGARPSS